MRRRLSNTNRLLVVLAVVVTLSATVAFSGSALAKSNIGRSGSNAVAYANADPVANPCTRFLSPLAQAREIAQEIRAGGGTPTVVGRSILDAAKTGNAQRAAEVLAVQTASGQNELEVRVLATGVPLTSSGTRALSSTKRVRSWSGYYYFWCGVLGQANISWYCPAGNSCSSKAYFSDGDVRTKSFGTCPGGSGGCYVLSQALPAFPNVVDWMQVYKSSPGPPSVISTWCS